ncbi:MAG: alpha/beta hydrolase [Acidobacteriota bacterium]
MKTLIWLAHVFWATSGTLARRLAGRRRRCDWSLKTELVQSSMHATLRASLTNGHEWFRSFQARGARRPFFASVVEFEESIVGGVPGVWTVPTESKIERTILYLHGGGYVFGTASEYRDLCSRLAVGANARIFAPEYRRAPEAAFPAAQDDCFAAYAALETPAEELVLCGDSAGAGLVMSVLTTARDAGHPLPAGGALLCPWVDPYGGGASMHTNEASDIGPARWIRWCAEMAIPSQSQDDPRVRPTAGDLAGLPPLLVQVGGAEMLHDQGVELAKALESAGVETQLHVEPNAFHVWQLLGGILQEADDAVAQICRFARSCAKADTTGSAAAP